MRFLSIRENIGRTLGPALVICAFLASTGLGAVGKSWGNSTAGIDVDFGLSHWDVFGVKTGVQLNGKITGHAMYLSADLLGGWTAVSQNSNRQSQIWSYGVDVFNQRVVANTSWFTDAPAKVGWHGPWNAKSYNQTIPIGPLPPIVVSAGYALAPGFNWQPATMYTGVAMIAGPEGTARVTVSGAMDAALLKGGIQGDLNLLTGGVEAWAGYDMWTNHFISISWRPYMNLLSGKIFAFAKNLSGFSCSWRGCHRTWNTFWTHTFASWSGFSFTSGWINLWSLAGF